MVQFIAKSGRLRKEAFSFPKVKKHMREARSKMSGAALREASEISCLILKRKLPLLTNDSSY